ncbi:FAD-dependent thymidylate synthase [Legionella sp. D16C41]|uniref:FAD-dependent thymidylate synthase n=1 Tax=Legionella sp. D16C41 TaxID=3402688 RepID=UPI003AF75292
MKQNNLYREKMTKLIKSAGGEIDETGFFVLKPGCMILNMTQETGQGKALYQEFNIDIDRPAYEQRAEFKSRVTYLSFSTQPKDATEYNKKMTQVYQHLSVHTATHIDFLIAGVTIETCLEFVAHTEAKVARLTSSNTKAMDETLYRLQGAAEEQILQKKFILNFIDFKKTFEHEYNLRTLSEKGMEYANMLNLATKVNAFTFSMNLKDYHKLFIGRLSNQGNEQEVQEICTKMCQLLHEQFPLVIKTPKDYYAMNNGVKYLS